MIVFNENTKESFPFPNELLFNISESKEMILSFLDVLPKIINSNINQNETNGHTPSIDKAFEISTKMLKKTGGRIILMQAQDNLYGSVF